MISKAHIVLLTNCITLNQILGTQESAQKMGINKYAKNWLKMKENSVELAASFSADSFHILGTTHFSYHDSNTH